MDKFMEYTKQRDDNRDEQERLEGQHELFIYSMGKAVFAPVDLSKAGLNIWDSGCANGRWLRDLQATAPAKHHYVGTDIEESLYPSPPPEGMHFQNQDIKKGFPSEWKDRFDFIHQRFVMAGAAPGTPEPVIEKFATALKPGAWLQLIEMNTDDLESNGPMLRQLIRMMREMFAKVGVGANIGVDLGHMMNKAGFENIEEKEVWVHHGAGIEDDSLLSKSIESPCSAVAPVFHVLRSLPNSFSDEEFDGFEGRLRKELEERGGQTRSILVWGQKPTA